MLSVVDMCFKHSLKCYDDVLAGLKRAFQSPSWTADFFFQTDGNPGFMLWWNFCSPTPKLFYTSLTVSQNYRNMMPKIRGGDTCLEQL